jgi:dihydrolipoamide dehydrogenase
MVICGGGVIGIEFAGIFASLGTEVTVVEYMPKILANLDEEVSKRLGAFLKKKRIKIETGVQIKEVKEFDEGLQVIAQTERGSREYSCDSLLMAAGRTPNLAGLDLDVAGIDYDGKGIKVNSCYETSAKGVYAIGDAIGGQMLAHVAAEEGKACVDGIYGNKAAVDYEAVPSCIFSFPEAAAVGITEEKAIEKGIDYLVGKFIFAANGKAMTLGETDGFIKIIADRVSGKILGVHIIGPHASDLISEGTLAIKCGLTVEQVKETIHAHPTLSEVFFEAVLDVMGESVHSLPRK